MQELMQRVLTLFERWLFILNELLEQLTTDPLAIALMAWLVMFVTLSAALCRIFEVFEMPAQKRRYWQEG